MTAPPHESRHVGVLPPGGAADDRGDTALMPYSIQEYSPRWPLLFAEERARLTLLLGRWLTTDVQHMGSTSVPGLSAKPTLDMMAGVPDLAAAEGTVGLLRAAGYAHAEHRPEARWFYAPPSEDPADHTHHLHLTVPGSRLWVERLTFRGALRGDAALRERYQRLKTELAEAHGSSPAEYTDGKRAFVAAVLAGHGVDVESR